jgi:hypothetical protein
MSRAWEVPVSTKDVVNQDMNVESTQLEVSMEDLPHQSPPLTQPSSQEYFYNTHLAILQEAYFK